MEPNDTRWQAIDAEATRLEVEHAPPAAGPTDSPIGEPTGSGDVPAAASSASRGPSLRRIIGTLVLAGGLLAIGGASVVMAASPQPSASTSPSTQGGHVMPGYGSGSMPGGCQHSGSGSNRNGSSGGSSSPSSSSGA